MRRRILVLSAIVWLASAAKECDIQPDGTCLEDNKTDFGWFPHHNNQSPLDATQGDVQEDHSHSLNEIRSGHHDENVMAAMRQLVTDRRDGRWQDLLLPTTLSHPSTEEPWWQVVWGFFQAVYEVKTQIGDTYREYIGDIGLFSPLALYYYMLYTEAKHNSVWKRRHHRNLPELPVDQAEAFGNALFLAELAYTDSCQTIADYLENFDNHSWTMTNCTTQGRPTKPAHFVMLQKQPPSTRDGSSHSNGTLSVTIVIRGTKTVADFLSDGMLEPVPYRNGTAHGGILASAEWLVGLYQDWLPELMVQTQSRKIQLWLVGHSLGAGTAAIASMEFQSSTVETRVIGFGTPACLSLDLSQSLQDSVTTVITDDDAVPRMSGASIASAWRDIAGYNWTFDALADEQQLWQAARHSIPLLDGILTKDLDQKVTQLLVDYLDSVIKEIPAMDPIPIELFPPGDCIHVYRDGVGWAGRYTPCERFDELQVVLHMLEDHLVPSGYFAALLGFVRRQTSNVNWQFPYDILGIPV